MIVAIVLAGVAVLVTAVLLAVGKGGELAEVHPDHPPLALPANRPIAGTDAVLLRLPRGLWGYHVNITDEALSRLAEALSERDIRIATLERRLADMPGGPEPAAGGSATAPPAFVSSESSESSVRYGESAPFADPAGSPAEALEPEPYPEEKPSSYDEPVVGAAAPAPGQPVVTWQSVDPEWRPAPEPAYQPAPPSRQPSGGWADEPADPYVTATETGDDRAGEPSARAVGDPDAAGDGTARGTAGATGREERPG